MALGTLSSLPALRLLALCAAQAGLCLVCASRTPLRGVRGLGLRSALSPQLWVFHRDLGDA